MNLLFAELGENLMELLLWSLQTTLETLHWAALKKAVVLKKCVGNA